MILNQKKLSMTSFGIVSGGFWPIAVRHPDSHTLPTIHGQRHQAHG